MRSLACGILLSFSVLLRAANPPGTVQVETVDYHGWSNCLLLRNNLAEVIIVPEIGRIMQFRFAGEQEGPFWEKRALDGKSPQPQSTQWINFGGDKTWPAPQADWPKITGRGWPPPVAFDAMPVTAKQEGQTVVLTSAVDPHYGIRTRRVIELHPNESRMTVITSFIKEQGDPTKVAVWVITQLKHPELVEIPLPEKSIFSEGYTPQSQELPEGLKRTGNLLTLKRSAKHSTKIGSDASTMIWKGEKWMLRIDSPRQAGGEYPDSGSSAEVYTNPDPDAYVELETLGPLQELKTGQTISQTNVYTLSRRP